MTGKTLIGSKTFWLAIIQAVGGGLIIYFTQVDAVGAVAIVKSFLDITLRIVTEDRIDTIV